MTMAIIIGVAFAAAMIALAAGRFWIAVALTLVVAVVGVMTPA